MYTDKSRYIQAQNVGKYKKISENVNIPFTLVEICIII